MVKIVGKNFATAGIALVSVGAIAGASTVQPPPRPSPVPVVQLAAASPTVAQPPIPFRPPAVASSAVASSTVAQLPPPVQRPGVLESLVELDLTRFLVPPSVTQAAPVAPPIPEPSPTAVEFEDLIIDTYHAIEPWVRYGFELVTWGVGWVPWVGWLAPQIMIFYDFGERIVESLVENSANWLWGPLPFGEGLVNIGQDSWDALVQLGIDQWNFWLWPLPPLPFDAEQSQAITETTPAATEAGTPAGDEPTSTARPHPRRLDAGYHKRDRTEWRDVREEPDVQIVPESDLDEVVPPDAEPATPDEELVTPEDEPVTGEDESSTSEEESVVSETDSVASDEKKLASRKSLNDKPRETKEATETSQSRSHGENDGRSAKRDYARSPRSSSSDAE